MTSREACDERWKFGACSSTTSPRTGHILSRQNGGKRHLGVTVDSCCETDSDVGVHGNRFAGRVHVAIFSPGHWRGCLADTENF